MTKWYAALMVALAVGAGARAEEAKGPNVLFIAVDDLRPQLGCYGDKHARTPHLDKLAKRGLVFGRAYVQQAVCSPSRTSLLTGRRPDTTKVYDLETHFRKHLPDVVTLPQHFKNNGYHTQSLGKIYHGGLDDKPSWSAPSWRPKVPGWGPDGQAVAKKRRAEALKRELKGRALDRASRGPAWEAARVKSDDDLPDGAIAAEAIKTLRAIKDKPFFLGVGFAKPHLPFVAPKKYWDQFDPDKLPMAANPHPPKGAPAFALHNSGELRAYADIPAKGPPVTKEQARKLVHGYYAATSYMDAQVGRVLDELERLKLADKTIVIVWGDHGWQLGEHGLWCKHTNYETSTRAALLLAAPGMKGAGKSTSALVEFVDVYPTLAALCRLPAPKGIEGVSFAPLLDDPGKAWKAAAFSQYPRQIPDQGRGMGYAMRTDRYRLVEWRVPGKEFRAYELYDHKADPGEDVNLAGKAEHKALQKKLTEQLHAGWRKALPPG